MDDITKLKSFLLYWIDCFESRGYKNYNINQMSIKSVSDRCNMTYKYYMNQPMQSVERRINMIIAENPQLINIFNRNENHPLLKNFLIYHTTSIINFY